MGVGGGGGSGNPSSEGDRSPSVINPLGRLKQFASTSLILSLLFGAPTEGIVSFFFLSPYLANFAAVVVVVDTRS